MAEAIGAVRADFIAESAQFRRAIQGIRNAANSNMRAMETQADKLNRGFRNVTKGVAAFRSAMIPIAAGTAIVTGAINKALDAADAIGKASIRVGLLAEDYQRLARTAELADVSQEQLVNGLTSLQRRLGEAERGTGTAIRALDELGISLDQLRGKAVDEQFRTLATAIANVEDPTQRSTIANDLFGRSYATLLPLMLQGGAAIEAAGNQFDVFSNQAVAASQRINDALGTAITDVWIQNANRVVLAIGAIAHALDLVDFPELDLARDIQDQLALIEQLQQAQAQGQPIRNARGAVTLPVGELDAAIVAAQARLEELRVQWDALMNPTQPATIGEDLATLGEELAEIGDQLVTTLTPAETLMQQLTAETHRAALEAEILRNGYDEAQANLFRMMQAAGATTTELAQMAPEAQRFLEVQRELLALQEAQAAAAARAAAAEQAIADAAQEVNDNTVEAAGGFDGLLGQLVESEAAANRLANSLVRGFTDSIKQADSLEGALKGIVLRTIEIIDQLLIELAVRELIAAVSSSSGSSGGDDSKSQIFSILGTVAGAIFGGPAGAAAGGTVGSTLGGGRAATGAVFDTGERLRRYAQGGIVDNPTLFPTKDGAGLMGEAGPEAILPLTRTSGGDLGVHAMLPARRFDEDDGGITVVNNLTVETGVSQTVRAEMLNLLPLIEERVKASIVDARRRNKMPNSR